MIWFNGLENRLVGGKARMLMSLSKSFNVPDGFVVLADEIIGKEILSSFDLLGAKKVAVRSSAVNEDSAEAAWAGQLYTLLNVNRQGLLSAIRVCRDSVGSERAKVYAATQKLESGTVAVIVQKMVNARISGVAFSRHPVTNEKRVVIEAVRGFGEGLVSGQKTPDTYIEGGETHLVDGLPILSDNELEELVSLVKRVERKLSFPVDIEWSYEADTLYLLQARPITTLKWLKGEDDE